ncbi:MAG TPA: MBL fold metallo-hydrolase [Anaeromyxobacteraceae bacterium]|nr:MBL fold metallo-hydrolase [Anaeromyxobacteraceae bacterium]
MELGFETIGNATLVCHDGGPVLVTDPWITGSAYFGSWTRSHEIPEQQLKAIRDCRFVWLSHGHPDHLGADSLELLRSSRILLPDHVGGRVHQDLLALGLQVEVLPDRRWVQLSPRIRVQSIPDWNQDAVLLVDLGGRLIVDLNDASDRGWGAHVRAVMRRYPETYLLALSGYGDADMINFFDADGNRIPPNAAKRTPVGQTLTRLVDLYGARFFVPFSSMHRYQRADSSWANEYTTGLADHGRGFASRRCEMLPAFVRRDFLHDRLDRIDPRENAVSPVDPREFGDDWDERLAPEEVEEVERYVRATRHVAETLGFVTFRVGGRDHRIALDGLQREKGITFEVPRGSLLTAVRYQVFDDLLIGNFMKTTLHGEFGPTRLYPDFSPYVAKYGDNGRARTREELTRYFRSYYRRDPLGCLRSSVEGQCVRIQDGVARYLRDRVGMQSPLYRAARETFWTVRRLAR